MKKQGYVHLVGIGPGDAGGISMGALQAIQNAEEIWGSDLGPPNRERHFLRPYLTGKKIVNLSGYYEQHGLPREYFYSAIPRRAIHLARQGHKITFLLSGNPMVWVDLTNTLKQEAAAGKVDLRITPSMSFLDVIWTHLPFGLTGSLQVRATLITDPDITPYVDCVVGQIGDVGTTGGRGDFDRFVTNVKRLYPLDHEVYITGSDPIHAEISTVKTTVAGLSETLLTFTAGYYVVVLPHLPWPEDND